MHEVFRDLSVFVCGEEFYGETQICLSEHTSEHCVVLKKNGVEGL